MGKSVFENTRGGVKHRYDVRQDGLHYTGEGAHTPATTLVVRWEELRKIAPGHGHSVQLVRSNGQKLGVWLEPNDLSAFLGVMVEAWGRKDKTTARKAAFDYGTPEPAVGWIWLALALLFPGLLTATLLSDGYHTLNCTHALERSSQIVAAEVVKIKKNRRGSFIWTMEFKTLAGEPMRGTREAPVTDENGAPLGSTPGAKPSNQTTVIYSPEKPNCWDISLTPGAPHVNEKQRHFTILMDLCFGWIFALVALVSVWFSVRRIARRHPGQDAVRVAGERIA